MRWLDDSREARVSRWIVTAVIAFLALHIVAGIANGTYPPNDDQATIISSPVATPDEPTTTSAASTKNRQPPLTPATSATTSTSQATQPINAAGPGATGRAWTWDDMADCESGDWDANKHPIAGTARWDDQRGGYEGGLHFLNGTWLQAGGARFAQHAYDASREQQIEIADSWLARTDLGQWPKCSFKIGAR